MGLSAQVDWKERITMTDRNGVPHTFSIFLYVLCILQNRSTQLCNIIIHSCVMKKAIV